jgi:hypothetical protein
MKLCGHLLLGKQGLLFVEQGVSFSEFIAPLSKLDGLG